MSPLTLLVATDFSENSLQLLDKAAAFAKIREAELHVIHVIEPSFFGPKIDPSIICQSGGALLSERLEGFPKEHFYCCKGDAKTKIAEYSRAIDAKMVFLGNSSTNLSVLEEFFVGSHTKNIIRSLECPALVIKTTSPMPYRRILISTDLSPQSKLLIEKTAAIFPDAAIQLLHLYDVPFEGRASMMGVNKEDVHHYQDEFRGAALDELNQFVATLDIKKERIRTTLRKGHLNPKLIAEEFTPYLIDLVCVHTTGSVSFFAFDLLEECRQDVLIMRV